MRLIDLPIKQFAKSWGTMPATWLGRAGAGSYLMQVPVRQNKDTENLPDGYFIRPSKSGLPIIQGGPTPTPGVITKLSTYNGDGPVVGQVYTAQTTLENVLVIAVVKVRRTRLVFDELLVAVTGPGAFFYLERTCEPDLLVEVGKDYVHTTNALRREPTYVSIHDPNVPKWRPSLDGKETND